MTQSNPYPLRLEKKLTQKIKCLSKENNRSYNKEIEWILRKYVDNYELEYGEINISEETD